MEAGQVVNIVSIILLALMFSFRMPAVPRPKFSVLDDRAYRHVFGGSYLEHV